jgi:hypothetical protein
VNVLFMLVVDYFVMMEVVQFFVDIVIFKMVNVLVDYLYDDFKDLY